jgi:hypothetical protein
MPKKRKQPAGLKKYWADKKKKANKRKTTTRKRRTTRKGDLTLKRKKAYSSKSKSKSNKPRKRSSGMKMPKIPSVIKKVAIGVGAASLASMAVGIVAPQFVGIARPIAALAAGGIPGVAGELLINQGLIGNITGMFGGGGINETRLASGL